MTSRWVLGACLVIAGSLLALSIWNLASWTTQATNPLRNDHGLWAIFALFFGFQFCIVAVGIVRWKQRELPRSMAWTTYVVTSLTFVLALVTYLVDDN
jgi:hypothetical protein